MVDVDPGYSGIENGTRPKSRYSLLNSIAEPPQEELPLYNPIDPKRCVWANPFTLPSRTVNGLYKGKRGWSKSFQSL